MTPKQQRQRIEAAADVIADALAPAPYAHRAAPGVAKAALDAADRAAPLQELDPSVSNQSYRRGEAIRLVNEENGRVMEQLTVHDLRQLRELVATHPVRGNASLVEKLDLFIAWMDGERRGRLREIRDRRSA